MAKKVQTKKAGEVKVEKEVEKTPAELINLVTEPEGEKPVEAPKAPTAPKSKPKVALLRKYLKFQ